MLFGEVDDIVRSVDNVVEETSGGKLDKKLIKELADSGVKYNVDDVVMVTKTSDGKLVWLEQGNRSAGLNHIAEGKAVNFVKRGMDVNEIPSFLEETLGTSPYNTGSTLKGLYADYTMSGKNYRVAYGSNGYIVSFYPID